MVLGISRTGKAAVCKAGGWELQLHPLTSLVVDFACFDDILIHMEILHL
jgi:hypothetical protein